MFQSPIAKMQSGHIFPWVRDEGPTEGFKPLSQKCSRVIRLALEAFIMLVVMFQTPIAKMQSGHEAEASIEKINTDVSIPYRKNAVGSSAKAWTLECSELSFNPLSQKCSRVIL